MQFDSSRDAPTRSSSWSFVVSGASERRIRLTLNRALGVRGSARAAVTRVARVRRRTGESVLQSKAATIKSASKRFFFFYKKNSIKKSKSTNRNRKRTKKTFISKDKGKEKNNNLAANVTHLTSIAAFFCQLFCSSASARGWRACCARSSRTRNGRLAAAAGIFAAASIAAIRATAARARAPCGAVARYVAMATRTIAQNQQARRRHAAAPQKGQSKLSGKVAGAKGD